MPHVLEHDLKLVGKIPKRQRTGKQAARARRDFPAKSKFLESCSSSKHHLSLRTFRWCCISISATLTISCRLDRDATGTRPPPAAHIHDAAPSAAVEQSGIILPRAADQTCRGDDRGTEPPSGPL
ncbi:hypothetical protein GWI33_015785 [Rhynchophorus ferrugineus]|uniref:Uncharacterized protein n=1 Tax=Rhynchophorus ferrugineus TaxID=354439 RepID=A0A834I3K8_RHYFE|nr:hypothetical protein GWI33_015785 [Rhynchophorus ferrugineus]